jgi:hypothetical protein
MNLSGSAPDLRIAANLSGSAPDLVLLCKKAAGSREISLSTASQKGQP